jgi:hypothetical protein
MRYKPSITSALFGDGTKVTSALHKGVVVDFIADADAVHIITIESANEGKGFAQEALRLLMKRYKGKRFSATVPLNPVAKHIFKKMGIEYPREE